MMDDLESYEEESNKTKRVFNYVDYVEELNQSLTHYIRLLHPSGLDDSGKIRYLNAMLMYFFKACEALETALSHSKSIFDPPIEEDDDN